MCQICAMMGRSASETALAHAPGSDAWIDRSGQTLNAGADALALSSLPLTHPAETLAAGTTAPNGKPVWSLSQVISNAERNGNHVGAPYAVTYQFYETAPVGLPSTAVFAPLTAEERALARQAFADYAEVSNLTFVEAADNGIYGSRSGRVSLYLDSSQPDYVWGSTVSHTRGSTIVSAEISISPAAVAARRLFIGGYNFLATLHEIGHSVGLPHPGDYNADGSTITYAANATYYQDSRQYSVLSYFDATNTGANFVPPGETASYSGSTLLLHDIAVLQDLYGANYSTRAGDTTYGYHSNAGNVAYDFTITTAPVVCIWDGGGNDTIDLSGSNYAARLDLNAGEFSDVLGLVGNLSIAYGAVIENAKGTSAGDTIVGNAVANRLEGLAGDDILAGRGGNDYLDGGAGVDTAAYSGAATAYDWWRNADGTWTVDDARTARPDGTDTLVNIEKLSFAGGASVTLPTTPQGFIDAAWTNILRNAPVGADLVTETTLAADVAAGRVTQAAAFAQIAARAISTTSVATLAYEFFTGSTPTKAGLDYLVSTSGGNANNLNSAYYQSFSIENRYINFAVNLGKLGEGAASFSTSYGSLSLFDATRQAYTKIFGTTPTDDKLHTILDSSFVLNGQTLTRAQYFAYYGGDGANGIGTKAAAVGWLLGEAAKADVGTYALSNDAYLIDLADGAHTHVDLIGAYNRPAFAYNG